MITALIQTPVAEPLHVGEKIFQPEFGRIHRIEQVGPLEKLITIELPGGKSLDHRPGQFMEVSILGVGEAPISISSSPSRSNGIFEMCVRKVGDVTGAVHRLQAGDKIGLRGPFGHGFPIEKFRGKDMLFAPGGLGLAPLRSLINQVLDERALFGRVILLYGAKTPPELLFKDELREWAARSDIELHLSVDRGNETWTGNVGVITTLFKFITVNPRNTVAVTVGPPAMYRFVLMEFMGMGIPEGNIYLDLERRMKCGVGRCGHCQINNIYACQSGPVFSYKDIKGLEEAL